METVRNFARRYGDILVCVAVFLCCWWPRQSFFAPAGQYIIDLEIYRAGGELISKGINPYDYSQGKAVREGIYRFHHDTVGWGFPASVDAWNFYAAGNLPLTLLLFGAIHKIDPSPAGYRAVFHVADALLGVVAFLLVRFRWGSESRRAAFFIALLFGLNGAIVKWGTIWPEDKGIQTLLIFATLALMVPGKNGWPRMIGVAVLEALAISFKILGVFFFPAVLLWAYRGRGKRGALVVGATVAAVALAINGHYLPWMLRLWRERMDNNTAPIHASIWIYPYAWWPWLAKLKAPLLLTALGALVAGVQVYRRKLTLESFGGLFTFLFCVVYLVAGSVDRMTMGAMIVVGALGIQRPSWGLVTLALWTAVGAGIYYIPDEAHEGALVLVGAAAAALILLPGTFRTWPFAHNTPVV